MAGKTNALALLLGGKFVPGKKAEAKKPKGTSRDDLKVAMRDFRNAKNDEAAIDAMLNFSELARDYSAD